MGTSLEERALRRDRRFLLRLVLMLLGGVIFGLFLFGKLTSADVGGCVARQVTGPGGPDGAGHR